MTYVEYAKNVLGIELLPYQEEVLNNAEKLKAEGKGFYINVPVRQGKALLNNCVQQKLGYDRGFEDGVREFAEWLPQHFDLRFSNNPSVWLDEFFNHTTDKILTEWRKEENNG